MSGKLAYIVLAHKHPEQLVRLMNVLRDENDLFYIHIDKKADIAIFKNAFHRAHLENINIVKREDGRWGGLGIVKAALNGIIAALETRERFDQIILLSGQDYPVKSIRYIKDYFHKNADKCFMEYFSLPHSGWLHEGMDRIERSHWYFRGRLYVYPPYEKPNRLKDKILDSLLGLYFPKVREFPKKMKPFGGSDWWSISREAAEYIMQFIHQNTDYIKFHQYSFLPSEGFFQTILLNSKKESILSAIVNDNLRYIDWSMGGKHPKTVTIDDFEALLDSDKLFARKFDLNAHAHIVTMIDKKILNA